MTGSSAGRGGRSGGWGEGKGDEGWELLSAEEGHRGGPTRSRGEPGPGSCSFFPLTWPAEQSGHLSFLCRFGSIVLLPACDSAHPPPSAAACSCHQHHRHSVCLHPARDPFRVLLHAKTSVSSQETGVTGKLPHKAKVTKVPIKN